MSLIGFAGFGIMALVERASRRVCQAGARLSVALFDVVSNFAAFKRCGHWVGNSPPSYRLPFFQLTYFAVRMSGSVMLPARSCESAGSNLGLIPK
jgi:hypothetical protein